MNLFHSLFPSLFFSPDRRKLRSLSAFVTTLAMLAALSACNSSSDSSNNSASDSGEVTIGLTDAPGDFTTYTVDVVSLTLTKANGAVVETVPVKTRVDFAQYTDMTEFFTAATIPSGTYVSATLTLDYSNADIQVEGDDGGSIPVSILQDEDGTALTMLELNVHLEDKNALFIAPGIPAHLNLDFDLNASNSVDLNNGSPIVTVSPYLLADVNVESSKLVRARGPLKSVDTAASSFTLVIRPFVHALTGGDARFGLLNVTTADNTVFDINGSVFQGGAGLTELSQQTALTAVVVIGDLKFNPRRFEATEVRAGSSVAGGTLDAVTGSVISRAGDVLTVKGATLIRQDGSAVFNDDVTVTVGDNTIVHKQLSVGAVTIADISVGQRITLFGSITSDQPQNMTMDATNGYAHLLFTSLRATVNGTSPLTLNVQSINGRRIALFDFSGTGATENADPANYEIDTGAINIDSITNGDVVKVRGFVKPFGKTGSADFSAQTIVNVSDIPGSLVVGWPQTSITALSFDPNAQNITLDLNGVGLFHHVSRAGVVIDLTQLATPTSIEAGNGSAKLGGMYFIVQNGGWKLHTSFGNYLNDLQSRLDQGALVRGVAARGIFDDSSAVMTASRITVNLTTPSTN